ncbi:protein ECT2-like isoform X2 [Amphibalanus amphitrite]|uniref:protein ECT2-like isoform X2 n=1 Tax=Amphibalanus amphitrite TaxID=1232801 RepID=UPI001C9169E4|nr:protein ECT2-like isoform X2 [Amphibalanus amphitrite]
METDKPPAGAQKNELASLRLCITEPAFSEDPRVIHAAEVLKLPITTKSIEECLADTEYETIFLVKEFDGDLYTHLVESEGVVVGRPALLDIVARHIPMPNLARPLYSAAMKDVTMCFTGFRMRQQLKRLVDLVHHLGGSVRREVGPNITHVVANACSGDKYRYAVTFGLPVLRDTWIETVWQRREELGLIATHRDIMAPHRVRPFFGARVRLLGFSSEEREHMAEVLVDNGGQLASEEPGAEPCTHLVVDDSTVQELPEPPPDRAHLVKAEWFWACIQMDAAADESMYRFQTPPAREVPSPAAATLLMPTITPSSRTTRKRKRLRETLHQLARDTPSPAVTSPTGGQSQPTAKRRSSITDINLLSTSGSFLDATPGGDTDTSTFAGPGACPSRLTPIFENPNLSVDPPNYTPNTPPPPPPPPPPLSAVDGTSPALGASPALAADLRSMSPRQQVFHELLQTETNYVKVLHTVVTLFKEPLEGADQVGGPLLEPPDIKIIFGNIPPIYEVHCQLRDDLAAMAGRWRDELSVGEAVIKYGDDLMRSYPPFVNFFEKSKETLVRLDQARPRFHAFLKISQSKPECGRQTLQELLIRPVQRLPSMILLLNDILKHTPKSHPDHQKLEEALAKIKEVMTHINEDKRRTEGQMALFNIFNDIENCPAHIVSSHRSFVTRCDVVEIKGDGLSGRGDHLIMFLFSDMLEVCKKRARYNSLRSPSAVSLQAAARSFKPYKHVELMPLAHIKRVVDIRETEECHNVFTLICRSNQELKERHYTFTISSEDVQKEQFLRTLCRQMAHVTCRADAENFLTVLDPQHLDIESSEVAGSSTLSRVSKFATKTGRKVGRAFSFKQTPNKLRRAVSTVISPFQGGTPSGPMSEMRMASSSNLRRLIHQSSAALLPSPSRPPPAPLPSLEASACSESVQTSTQRRRSLRSAAPPPCPTPSLQRLSHLRRSLRQARWGIQRQSSCSRRGSDGVPPLPERSLPRRLARALSLTGVQGSTAPG